MNATLAVELIKKSEDAIGQREAASMQQSSLGLTSFTESTRTWLAAIRDQQPANELISFSCAISQIQAAVSEKRPIIDIPLAPHLSILGSDSEQQSFAESIMGQASHSFLKRVNSRLLTRIFGNDSFEIKVVEGKISNPHVVLLLKQLRAVLPEVDFELRASWNKLSGMNGPLFSIRMKAADALSDAKLSHPTKSSKEFPTSTDFELDKLALALPANSSRRRLGAENHNLRALKDFMKDFDDNYKRARRVGYNVLMAEPERNNYGGAMTISGDTLFTSHIVTVSSVLNFIDERAFGRGRYISHGDPPPFIWPVPETFLSPAIEEAKSFLTSKGLRPVFFRPKHWLTFGLTGEFVD